MTRIRDCSPLFSIGTIRRVLFARSLDPANLEAVQNPRPINFHEVHASLHDHTQREREREGVYQRGMENGVGRKDKLDSKANERGTMSTILDAVSVRTNFVEKICKVGLRRMNLRVEEEYIKLSEKMCKKFLHSWSYGNLERFFLYNHFQR